MLLFYQRCRAALVAMAAVVVIGSGVAAPQATSGSINGTVLDPSGAVVPNAEVQIHNPVSGYDRTTKTDARGSFNFSNLPYNPYHMTVTAQGFAQTAQDVEVRSVVPVTVNITVQVTASAETVTVESAGDLVETDSVSHTDVDKSLFDKLPLESQSSSLSSLVTAAAPGVAADSNGQFHTLGDHAQTSFSVDGQGISDQQSKVFSNQIPLDSVQSLEVIEGAPPAEYGGKTSMVINVTTRSGQGMTTPHGDIKTSYGSFGTATAGFNFGYGGAKWGNFISVDGLNTAGFSIPPNSPSCTTKEMRKTFSTASIINSPPRIQCSSTSASPAPGSRTRIPSTRSSTMSTAHHS